MVRTHVIFLILYLEIYHGIRHSLSENYYHVSITFFKFLSYHFHYQKYLLVSYFLILFYTIPIVKYTKTYIVLYSKKVIKITTFIYSSSLYIVYYLSIYSSYLRCFSLIFHLICEHEIHLSILPYIYFP